MKFTFAAALFAVASGAAAAPEVQSKLLQQVHSDTGYLLGGDNLNLFARRLDIYPEEYDSRGCLPDIFKDKCEKCMCLKAGEGNPVQTKHCDLSAPGDGTDHCVDKGATGSECSYNWQCQSSQCENADGTGHDKKCSSA